MRVTSGAASRQFRFVFFDVDSTLVTIEGIDVLGDGNPEIARLTERGDERRDPAR